MMTAPMARSSLFHRLRRLVRRSGTTSAHADGLSRRAFLQALGSTALAPALGCGDNVRGNATPPIAIIGGGIAGLTAAHFLALAGVRADVYEASMRIGGRMYSQRDLPDGQLVELGGELVDSNHVVIPMLCQSYGLALDDLVAATAGLKQDVFHFNGAALAEAAIVAAFTPVAAKMQLAIAASEGNDPASAAEFERIDAMSIPEWLESEAGLAPGTPIRELLEVAYLEEYGLEVSEQSAWNLLYLIDSAQPDPFRVFGDSDERYHIHEGNDALPLAIAEHLADRIHLDHALTKVEQSGDRFALTFANGTQVTAAHVIYALPFTRLREVDLAGAGLSADKLEVIAELGYGTNAKLMMQFTDRHWETAHGSGGGVITDVGQLQTIWATSRGQAGTRGILTNFVGGTRGLEIGSGTPESHAQMVLPWIDTVFPGTAAKYVANSAVRMHWPSYEHTKGSYACYKVGQWAYFGTEGAREGNQHFCGEHCSEDFQGYMEGGAETGAMVAAEILDDLAIDYPPQLAGLISVVTAERPRASYHAGFGKRMKVSQIRRRPSTALRPAVTRRARG
jgi:monoamine oxidase